MKPLFTDTRPLDKACTLQFELSEDIMMENAATALESEIKYHLIPNEIAKILIIVGSGNNGGDGMALARRLQNSKNLDVSVCCIKEPKSEACKIQYNRAVKVGVQFIVCSELEKNISNYNFIVDCLYGSGFHGEFDSETKKIIELVNASAAFKIACDIPSGIDSLGVIESKDCCGKPFAFNADKTITMGALKLALYSDVAKDFCGKIECANLGISRIKFENADSNTIPAAFLLEKSDLHLPVRNKQCVNKGSFGHTVVVCGQKQGAAILAGNAAMSFGCGLVTLLQTEKKELSEDIPFYYPPEIMQAVEFPVNTKSVALGMGVGVNTESSHKFLKYFSKWFKENTNVRCVFDADIFSSIELIDLLEQFGKNTATKEIAEQRIVLTPHPKEFSSLLTQCGFGEYSIEDCIKNRVSLSKNFVEKYPNIVLLVKGSNVCITYASESEKIETVINPFGHSCLAKGGSGDVLSGLIASLLAQGYSTVDATISASLAHALAAKEIAKTTSYGMTASILIDQIRCL